MKTVTVIIHGWSDCSESFENLKNLLIKKKIGTVKTILYADYESREDNMTFEDIVDGLNDRLIEEGLIDAEGSAKADLNVIVHSTGGLVIRHWIWRYYGTRPGALEDCPVKRIVMLAPANFGSHLAHRGKSFFPSLVKGQKKVGDFLETGKRILDGLELGSPYQWKLAENDLIRDDVYYTASRIQMTVLVGAEGYGGLAKVVNREGTDGTVLIAGTAINSAKLVLDFTRPRLLADEKEYQPYSWQIKKTKGDFAFGVFAGYDHGSIVRAAADGDSEVAGYLLQALEIRDAEGFRNLRTSLAAQNETMYKSTQKEKFQQFLVHAVDDQNTPIQDYMIDFFVWGCDEKACGSGELITREKLSKKEYEYSQKITDLLTEQFHTHRVDPSHRSFHVNLEKTKRLIGEAVEAMGSPVAVSMRMVVPRIDRGIRYDTENLQNIVLYHSAGESKKAPLFFFENTTTLLELRVNRVNDYVTLGSEPRKH